MIANWVAASLRKRDIHYGWVVVGVTFLVMLVTAGAVGAPGVFIGPLEKEFGWRRDEVSAALAIRFALFGLMGPFAAAFMNRFGVRRVVLAALSIIIAGLGASLFMSQIWQLVLLWGVAVGIGTGLMAMVLGATVAMRWFSERRGPSWACWPPARHQGSSSFFRCWQNSPRRWAGAWRWGSSAAHSCSLLLRC